MKKNIKSIYLLEIIMLLFAVFLPTLTKHIQLNKYMLKVAFSVIIFFAFIIRFGIKKDSSIFKKYTILVVVINLLIALIIVYVLGLFVGYNSSLFSLDLKTIISGLGLTVIDVACVQLVRFIICKNSFENKKPIIFYTILLVLINIVMHFMDNTQMHGYVLFEFVCVIVIGDAAKEALCSYLTYNIALAPSLIFDMALSIYSYVLPIIPTLTPFLNSIIHVILPFSIYSSVHKMLGIYDTKSTITNEKVSKIIFWPIFAILIVVVILVAGIFRYKMIAIASNSMNPIFYRGDAIIYEKVSAIDIGEGEIVVFMRDNKIISHRVIKKYKKGDDILFVTKGDNNNTQDSDFVHSKDVLGRAERVVKWIGYPTVLFSEFIEKE